MSVSEEGVGAVPDFWTFADVAVDRATARLPEVDPDAMRLILTLHRAVGMIVYDLESSVHRPRGLSWPGFRVLFVLWIMGPLEMRRVAELSGMSRAAVSALVKTLERDELVERRPLEYDRRLVELSLSATGRAEIARAFGAHNRREALWAEALSADERSTMIGLLRKLTECRAGDVRRRT